MGTLAHRRHDIWDRTWEIVKDRLPGREGIGWGRARDNQLFLVCWMLRTGSPRRDVPPDDGDWKNTHRRFCRWRDKGIWEALLESLVSEPDDEWLMMDASHVTVHPHASGAKGGNQDMARTKGGTIPRTIWPWMRMGCRSEWLLRCPSRLHTGSRLNPGDFGRALIGGSRIWHGCDSWTSTSSPNPSGYSAKM